MLGDFPKWQQIHLQSVPLTKDSLPEPSAPDPVPPLPPVTLDQATATEYASNPLEQQSRRPRGRPPGRSRSRASALRDHRKRGSPRCRPPRALYHWILTRPFPVLWYPVIKNHLHNRSMRSKISLRNMRPSRLRL